MKIIVVNFAEPLPSDPSKPRNYRGGMLVNYLAERGHHVTWVASGFDHHSKTQRSHVYKEVEYSRNVKHVLLPSPAYKTNISIKRFWNHVILGRELKKFFHNNESPDIVFCGFPPIETAYESVVFCTSKNIPVIVDIRDRWPELIVEQAPSKTRGLLRLFLWWYFRKTEKAFSQATHLTGTAEGMVDFAIKAAKKRRMSQDLAFYMAYEEPYYSSQITSDADHFWDSLKVYKDHKLTICFFGTFVSQTAVDIETCIKGFGLLGSDKDNVRVVLCGTGPKHDRLKQLAFEHQQIILPGRVTGAQIWQLMKRSHLGLLPYKPESHFIFSIPNKAPEYMAGRLPILTSLNSGTLHQMLKENNIGTFYESGDPASFAKSVRKAYLLKNQSQYEALRASSYSLFQRLFSSDVVYSKMVAWVEEIHKNYIFESK